MRGNLSLIRKIPMGLSLLCSKITGKRFPFMVNWAITGNCNLRCKHCYGSYGILQKGELSLEQIKSGIDELKKMGTMRITLEGGEPLVHKNIVDIIDYIHQKKMEMSLCTNGVLLEKYISDIKGKVDLIVLSLDGNEKRHNALRGKNNFKKVLNALKIAQKNNFHTLIFSCLIDENIKDIDFLVSLAEEYKTNITFNIAVAKLADNKERKSLNKVTDREYRNAIQKILDYKKKGAPIYYSDDNYMQAFNWPSFDVETLCDDCALSKYNRLSKWFIPCYAGINYCYIECNGDVYPCYQTVGTLKVKNIVRDGAREAFQHLATQKYCKHCYNLTLSELNLQCKLEIKSVFKVIKNYLK